MPPSGAWIVLKSVHPTGSNMVMPAEVAGLLGFTPDVAAMEKPARTLAFLSRGERALRVISPYRCGELYTRELAQHNVVATTYVNTARMIFHFPEPAERYLGVSLYQGFRPGVAGTDESIAWVASAEEVVSHRKRERLGRASPILDGSFPVYITKAIFPALLPPVSELERARPGGASVSRLVRPPMGARRA